MLFDYSILTPLQKRLMAVLEDGGLHLRPELHACCGPSSPSAISPQLVYLRKKINPLGFDIVHVRRMNIKYYQLVRLISSGSDGRK